MAGEVDKTEQLHFLYVSYRRVHFSGAVLLFLRCFLCKFLLIL